MNAERQILTGADQLLDHVSEHKVLSLKKASRIMQRDRDSIKLLAESLEDCDKVVLYQTINGTLIVDRGHYHAMNGAVKTTTVLKNIFSFGKAHKAPDKQELEDRRKALDELSSSLAKRAADLESRFDRLAKRAEQLTLTEEQLVEKASTLEDREQDLLERARKLQADAEELRRKQQSLEKREQRARKVLEKTKELFS